MTGWLAPVGLRLLLHDTGAKEVDPELASHGGGWGVTGPSWLDSWSSLIADSSRGSCAVRAAAPWHPLSQPATAGVAEGREEVGATHLHQGEGTDLALRFYELWIFPKYPARVNLVTKLVWSSDGDGGVALDEDWPSGQFEWKREPSAGSKAVAYLSTCPAAAMGTLVPVAY